MENGGSNLADKFSALTFNDKNNDGLFQVMKAVEAAEVTIKQQVEENNRLRDELLKKNHELEKYKVDGLKVQSPHPVDNWDVHSNGLTGTHLSVLTNQADRAIGINNSYERDPAGTLGLREVVKQNVKDQTYGESHSKSSKMSGPTNAFPGGQTVLDNAGFSQYLSASTSFSPGRYQSEGEYTSQFNLSNGQGLMSVTNVNPKNPLKQDLVVKTQEHEEEILQLRKHLTEYSIKEAQLRSEKYVLEKRIAYLRMAFDQQQQELVDAATKAITYRQDIIEENIRLSYALQEAQQERSTFVSSLMPILAEYSFQPPVADAQSIVSNLKVIFKHLQEKLIITETKLKESHYQMTLWNSDTNPTNFTQSPSHLLGPKGLELVPQPTYSNGQLPVSSDPIKTRDWDVLGSHQNVGGNVPNNLETDDLGRYSPIASRNTVSQGTHVQDAVSQGDSRPNNSESTSKQVKFSDAVSSIETDDPEMEGGQIDSDHSNWDSKSPYATDDPSSSYSPYLPPVLEEPSSSFSEAADDDPLPAVEGLQISGEAFPGRELQASGYSINGTTSCNFEWVRHLEDGSVNYIDGAKQPNYLVSADDIDTYLAIEVQPMDDRKRKGELVKVFANEHRKISCDPEMHNLIKKTLSIGHASYTVYHSVGYLDMWERASLVIKREGFSIKGTETGTSLVTEKFSPATTVIVPCGNPTDFSIISGATECLLRAENSSSDIACSRDTIVLTLRLFIIRAGDKKKGKKKGLFFNK